MLRTTSEAVSYRICLLVLDNDPTSSSSGHCETLINGRRTFPFIMSLHYLLSELKPDVLCLWLGE